MSDVAVEREGRPDDLLDYVKELQPAPKRLAIYALALEAKVEQLTKEWDEGIEITKSWESLHRMSLKRAQQAEQQIEKLREIAEAWTKDRRHGVRSCGAFVLRVLTESGGEQE